MIIFPIMMKYIDKTNMDARFQIWNSVGYTVSKRSHGWYNSKQLLN